MKTTKNSMLALSAALASAVLFEAGASHAKGIDAKFHGPWAQAALEKGQKSPQLKPCLATKIGSMTSHMNVTAKGGTYTVTNVLGSGNCQGDNWIKGQYRYEFAHDSGSGKEQILKVTGQSHEVTIKGQGAVKQLNDKKVCGFTGWEAKTYVSGKSPLKDCTFKNMGLSIPPHISMAELKNWRTKLSLVGKGLAVSSSMTPKGKFMHSTYYVKK